MTSPTRQSISNPSPLPDDSSSEEDPERQTLQVTEEEKQGTIPRSTEATAMALAITRAQMNPVVERSKPCRVKKTKTSKSVQQVATQTDKASLDAKQ